MANIQFRTVLKAEKSDLEINHDSGILMLGSCFTDNVGAMLEHDGFKVTHNPMGPLYNPGSILFALNRISQGRGFDAGDIVENPQQKGLWHCLAFASRYQDTDKERLLDKVNADFDKLAAAFASAKVLIITLGTSIVYKYMGADGMTADSVFGNGGGTIVGNCHKFPAMCFSREMLTADQCASCLGAIGRICAETGKTLILTVSPIRHLADGAQFNTLSKARLIEACHRLVFRRPDATIYFPAFELMNDDLRDYRFYAEDMVHPSDLAVKYIYKYFAETFFSKVTVEKALACRKEYQRSLHRPIILDETR